MGLKKLLEAKKIAVIDGAMGTQLELRGAHAGGISNIGAPEKVAEIHRAYIDAGADIIISNTFCMNRIYIETHKIEGDLETINRRGVEIAREASAGRVVVLGEIGLSGQLLEPYGDYTEQQLYDSFIEQARIVASAGVDAFIIETATDLRELLCALRACKENFSLPVIASMSYSSDNSGGRTPMGNKAADCAAALRDAGADILGLNCGDIDPKLLHIVVSTYRSVCDLPIMVEPNAGKPRIDGEKTVYDMTPDAFAAEVVAPCIDAGATIVGGCCGTSPDHIRAAAKLAAQRRG